MAKAAAYLETISLRRTIVVAGVCGVLLLVAIIVGTRGPSTFDSTIISSYNCTNNSHVWNPSTCNGVQMSMSVSEHHGLPPSQKVSELGILYIECYLDDADPRLESFERILESRSLAVFKLQCHLRYCGVLFVLVVLSVNHLNSYHQQTNKTKCR